MVKFTLPIVPPKATAQQKGVFVRNGRAHFFKKANVVTTENLYAALLEKYRPEKPAEGPIQIRITFVFPYRKSEKKTLVTSNAVIAHTVRPDLDNMEKALLDTMTRLGFWKDDAQIFDKSTAKVWGPTYGVRIVYDELAEIRGYI